MIRSDSPPTRAEVWVRLVQTREFENSDVAARARASLDHAEWQTLVRLRERDAQSHFLAGRFLARTMLAEISGQKPREVHIRTTYDGRSELLEEGDKPRPRFSISHADGIVLCAVALGCRVGADVESLRHLPSDPMGLAENLCSEDEGELLLAMPREDRDRQLLAIWTLKEAVAKATGLGLRLPLDRVTVMTCFGAPAVLIDGTRSKRWTLLTWRATPQHLASLAVRHADAGQVVFNFQSGCRNGIPAETAAART